jgi:hypothetical protein
MTSFAQSFFSSEIVGVLLILVLFVVFLLPFDRRFIERYIMQLPVTGGTDSEKAATDDARSGAALPGGPYTRQMCKMLELEVVVVRDLSSSHDGPRFVQLAIGRWNEEAWEFEVVTEWCETWEDLEEEARRAMKSFQGIASPNYRGASSV